MTKNPDIVASSHFEGHTLIMYEDKIYVPESLHGRTHNQVVSLLS
jgi:hypothetical protein